MSTSGAQGPLDTSVKRINISAACKSFSFSPGCSVALVRRYSSTIARTFLVAGAKSVLASLWENDDRFTATVMTHFYRHIADGESAAEALGAAQSELLTEFGKDTQPYYWAGFMVIGDGTRKVFSETERAHARPAR